MGQRLLLAITLLIVARIATFISPLPAEQKADSFQHESVSRLPQTLVPVAPTGGSTDSTPPLAGQGKQQGVDREWALNPSIESKIPDDRNDTNPVQSWSEPPPNRPAPRDSVPESYQAKLEATDSAAACQSVNSAVVTVIPGKGVGSGSIVSPDGLVITNNHVVKHLGNRTLYVKLSDGSRYEGKVIAIDRVNDLALIRAKTQSALPTIQFSAERTPTVGQAVCAIGSPYGQPGVITEGVLRRVLRNGDLQSDLVLKPGNSGGPLLNVRSEMIGVNKRIIRDDQGGVRASFSTNGAIAKEFVERNRNNSPMNPEEFSTSPSKNASRRSL